MRKNRRVTHNTVRGIRENTYGHTVGGITSLSMIHWEKRAWIYLNNTEKSEVYRSLNVLAVKRDKEHGPYDTGLYVGALEL